MNLRSPLLLFALLLLSPCFCLLAQEDRANLSYAKQKIHILPGFEMPEAQPVEQIIFLHIPKTAGTNLDKISSALSRTNKKFHHQRLPVPRVTGRSPNLITSDWIGGLKQLENNPHLLDNLPQNCFLTGHFPYGLHRHLTRHSKYITLIRNPLTREFSDANFAYQRGFITAEQFISYLLDVMIDNPQVRLIAGLECMQGPCSEETLQKAKENIERDFLLAAPIEDVDTFIQLLASLQGWGPIAYAPMQVTGQKVADAPSPALAQALLEKHKWDLELYEWVKKRWYEKKKRSRLIPKTLSPDAPILTLMPDYLTSLQVRFFTISELNAYNLEHQDDSLFKLNQTWTKPAP